MKRISFFLVMSAITARAEVIHYGKYVRQTELRQSDSTLLLFKVPPISASCQPGNILKFEPLTPQTVTDIEKKQLVQESNQTVSVSQISKMIRANPLSQGVTTCSFILSDGDIIGVEFTLTSTKVEPIIEFRPLGEIDNLKSSDSGLVILRGLFNGEALGFIKEVDNYLKHRRDHFDNDQISPYQTNSKLAKYKLEYAGQNGVYSAYRFSATSNTATNYQDIKLNIQPGIIFYSLVYPQIDLKKFDIFKLLIVASNEASTKEILKALP